MLPFWKDCKHVFGPVKMSDVRSARVKKAWSLTNPDEAELFCCSLIMGFTSGIPWAQSYQPIRRAKPPTDALENGPLFVARRLQPEYNRATRYLPIRKNVHFISNLKPRVYKKHKNCKRFQ